MSDIIIKEGLKRYIKNIENLDKNSKLQLNIITNRIYENQNEGYILYFNKLTDKSKIALESFNYKIIEYDCYTLVQWSDDNISDKEINIVKLANDLIYLVYREYINYEKYKNSYINLTKIKDNIDYDFKNYKISFSLIFKEDMNLNIKYFINYMDKNKYERLKNKSNILIEYNNSKIDVDISLNNDNISIDKICDITKKKEVEKLKEINGVYFNNDNYIYNYLNEINNKNREFEKFYESNKSNSLNYYQLCDADSLKIPNIEKSKLKKNNIQKIFNVKIKSKMKGEIYLAYNNDDVYICGENSLENLYKTLYKLNVMYDLNSFTNDINILYRINLTYRDIEDGISYKEYYDESNQCLIIAYMDSLQLDYGLKNELFNKYNHCLDKDLLSDIISISVSSFINRLGFIYEQACKYSTDNYLTKENINININLIYGGLKYDYKKEEDFKFISKILFNEIKTIEELKLHGWQTGELYYL